MDPYQTGLPGSCSALGIPILDSNPSAIRIKIKNQIYITYSIQLLQTFACESQKQNKNKNRRKILTNHGFVQLRRSGSALKRNMREMVYLLVVTHSGR